MKILTSRFWVLVLGLLTPELAYYVYQYSVLARIMTEDDLPLTPFNAMLFGLFGVLGLRLVALVLLGLILSYLFWKWPHTGWGRFSFGVGIGGLVVAATLAGVDVRF